MIYYYIVPQGLLTIITRNYPNYPINTSILVHVPRRATTKFHPADFKVLYLYSGQNYPKIHTITSTCSIHSRVIKCDLAILTEWWQQRIAWWELLNAECQIICMRKQQHTWYKAYSAGQTVPSMTAQIRAEGNNTKCVGKKRFNGSVTHGLRKEHVLRSPLSFWTRYM